MDSIKILVIAGPTAVGKTAFAIHAASAFNGEIISCDSMQIYRGMDIGTAKPSKEELERTPHHLIDIADPSDEFSAARFSDMAQMAIEDVSNRGRLPIICGGTGLYLDGILYEMDYGNSPSDPDIRRELEEIYEKSGPLPLHEELKKRDPVAAEAIHPNNVKRMIRALERLRLGEKSLKPFSSERIRKEGLDPLLIGLTRPREELYERIDLRVDKMMEEGLEEEVKRLSESGLTLENTSMLGIGYKEIYQYLQGGSTIDEAVKKIKTGTRHYAKRQFTWFRRYDTMKWIDISRYGTEEKAIEAMDEMISTWLDEADNG